MSYEITASAMRHLDQALNLKGRATNLNQQVPTFILDGRAGRNMNQLVLAFIL
ncbi:hypothetical protein ACVDHJ_20975 [Aeromonas sp. 25-281]